MRGLIPRVGIDARKARDFGIGTYTRQLVAALAEQPDAGEFLFTLFIRPGDENLFRDLPGYFAMVVEDAPGYSLAELTGFARRLRRADLDLFHAMHYVLPPATGTPAVVTIHDLIHLQYPDALPGPLGYPYARVMIGRALAASRAVITASDSVRRELEELAPGQASKIRTVPHGVSSAFLGEVSERELTRVRTKYALPERFALYLGGARPHKNLPRVVDAFSRAHAPGLSLVLAGPAPPDVDLRIAGRADIRSVGIIDEPDLPALYRAAVFLLYPTLAEGFGLPVLEAMASGTPVIASSIPVFREVAGDAALLVDPRDVSAIARAVEELYQNGKLRADLAQKGTARARGFSWAKAAASTLMIYRRALEGC